SAPRPRSRTRRCRRPRRRTPPARSYPSSRARPARRRARTGSGVRGRARRPRARSATPRTFARCRARAAARASGRSSSGRGQPVDELADQADAVARAAALPEIVVPRPGQEARSGYVDVGPGPLARELAQELGREHGDPLPADVRVLQVGVVGIHIAAVPRMERPWPGVVAARLAGLDDERPPVAVVREDAGVEIAERAV